jgi:uncharacterized repeat protein (TIGR03803 family)
MRFWNLSLCAVVLAGCSGGSAASVTAYSPPHPAAARAVQATGAIYRVMHNFTAHTDGAYPGGELTPAGDALWGSVSAGGNPSCSCGGVFGVPLAGGAVKTIPFNFATDGAHPQSGLTPLFSMLWGTASGGGKYSYGTIFAIDTSTLQVVYTFAFHGSDGKYPNSELTFHQPAGSTRDLFGTTTQGGNNACDCGTIFVLNGSKLSNVTFTNRWNFNRSDGAHPNGLLDLGVQGELGSTSSGGTGCGVDGGCGLVFLYPGIADGDVTRFSGGTVGSMPVGALSYVKFTQGANTLGYYGVTRIGGYCAQDSRGCGTIYHYYNHTLTPSLYHFKGGADGAYPNGNMTLLGQELFGTTERGGGDCGVWGASGCGTVFAFNVVTKTERVVYRFNGPDGAHPNAGLALIAGVLYGTTRIGGTGTACGDTGCGTVFSLEP